MQSMAGADPSESPSDASASDESRAASSDARADADRAPVAAAATPSPATAPTRSPAQAAAPAAPSPHAAPAPNDRTVSTSDDPTPPPTSPRPSGLPSPDDPTRTSTGELPNEPPVALRPREDRLPAPLQIRDPDRYQIINEHGRGGLGRVFRARDKELGRDVAVKELLHRGNTAELRFFREALITARLEHPGIVPVHEAGRWPDGTPFYAMKLVQGRPLKALIDECKTLEDRLALLPHIIAVADAIAYAHDRKIIHRDLKPSNVIVGDFGETVVIDWGLAKDLTDEVPEPPHSDGDGTPYRPIVRTVDGLTVVGSVLGTPAFMPPEQARGEAVDERADIYAIGAIAHQLLASTPIRDVPSDLRSVIARATAADKELRYPSAKALVEDLSRFVQGQFVHAHRYSRRQRITKWVARRRSIVVSAFVALTLTTAVSTSSWLAVSRKSREAARSHHLLELQADELTLSHARTTLADDPATALQLLTHYRGSGGSWGDAAALASDAISRPYTSALLIGHNGRITNLATATDAHVIVTTSSDGTARSWPTTGPPVSTLLCDGLPEQTVIHLRRTIVQIVGYDASAQLRFCNSTETNTTIALPFPPLAVTFASDGDTIYVSSDDGRLAEISTPSLDIRRVTTLTSPAHTLIPSPDGSVLAISTTQASRIDGRTLESRHLLHADAAPFVAGAAGGDSLAALDSAGCITVFAHDHHRRACPNHDHRAATTLQDVNPSLASNGRYGSVHIARDTPVAVLMTDRRAWYIDLASLEATPLPARQDVGAVQVSANGAYVLLGHDSGLTILYGVRERTHLLLGGHHRFVYALAFLTDGDLWSPVTGGQDREVRVWRTPSPWPRVAAPTDTPIFHVRPTASGRLFMDAMDGNIRVVDGLPTPTPHTIGTHAALTYGLAVSHDGRTIATAGWDGAVRIWDEHGTPQDTLRSHTELEHVALSTYGGVAAADTSGRVWFWSNALSETKTHQSHRQPITGLAFLGRNIVVSTSKDGSVVAYDFSTQSAITHSTHSAIESLAVSRSADHIAIGCRSGRLSLYSTQGAHALDHQASFHFDEWITNIAYSPTDALLAVGLRTGKILVIDLRSWAIKELRGHSDLVTDIDFSRDGHWLVSASQDTTLRLWEIDSGKSAVYRATSSPAQSVTFDALMTHVIAVYWDGSVAAWQLTGLDSAPPANKTLSIWLRNLRIPPSDIQRGDTRK